MEQIVKPFCQNDIHFAFFGFLLDIRPTFVLTGGHFLYLAEDSILGITPRLPGRKNPSIFGTSF